jgi:hypothetical protein
MMVEKSRELSRQLNGQKEPRKAAIKNRLVDAEVRDDMVFAEPAHEITPCRNNAKPYMKISRP